MSLRTAVIGANGKIGTKLVALLAKNSKFHPVALVRSAEQFPKFQEIGVESCLFSLEEPVETITSQLRGFDAVVFTAGAGGASLEKTLLIDLDGCSKALEACKANGIKRFVLVSAIESENRSFWWNTSLRNYYICKRYADHECLNSGLDYTILKPGLLTDTEATGKICNPSKVELEGVKITRADVALCIEAVLEDDSTIGKCLDLCNGEVPIKQAIRE